MKGPIRILLAAVATLACAAGLVACGGGVPSNAVAKVGDSPITLAAFNHWLTIANNTSAGTVPGQPKPPLPQPPNFTACVAYLQKQSASQKTKPTAATLKSQCQTQYAGLRDQVMQLLISADWIQGEAADQGLKASDKEVNQTFQQLKQQQFPTSNQFQQFLSSSGYTTQDLLFRVRINVLTDKIRNKVIGKKGNVSQQQIAAYYNKNKSRFGQPERRDLRLVLTKTAAQANQAKAAVQSGQSFKTVSQRFSIDQASKAQGGALTGVTRGTQEQALDQAIFSAKVGQLVGPIKTPFGFYVFRVQKVTPASQQSLAQASPSIKQILAAQGQQNALSTFVKNFDKKWRGRTNCRKGYIIANCSNAPKSTQTTPSTGGATGAPPPQGTTGR